MKKIKSFLITVFIGGVTIILPVMILAGAFGWIFRFVTNLIQPLTNILLANFTSKEIVADTIAILIIVCSFFLAGLFVRTRFGKWIFLAIENSILKIIPGYTLVKETVSQLFNSKQSPFSAVALAQIFDNDTLVTCFVTDRHENGTISVFVPTGPNPTSGNIYHLKKELVHEVDVSVESAMRSIISCGAGSPNLSNKKAHLSQD